MSDAPLGRPTRRSFLVGTAGAVAAASLAPACRTSKNAAKLKVGFLLPYTGVFAEVGQAGDAGARLAIAEAGGKLGGREVEFVKVDDESDPAKAAANTNQLVTNQKVDFLIGSAHSAVTMSMIKIAREEGTITVIPCSGLAAATRELCAPNVFRTSATNWQPGFPMGNVVLKDGYKRVATFCWKFTGALEGLGGFKDGFTAGGGTIMKEIFIDFPNVEFQAYLTEIAALKPEALFVWFANNGAAKFVKDYAAAGLKDKIPLYATGYLTETTVLPAMGAAAEGIKTTLFYSEELDTPVNKRFREAYRKATGKEGDVYAMMGYDAGKLLVDAVAKVQGDTTAKKELIAAMESAKIDSPRGSWAMSKAHNPIQDVYVRQVKDGKNVVLGVAHKALEDPGTGCKMG